MVQKSIGKNKMRNSIDVTGMRFGRLVAISRAANDSQRNTTWLCKCDCGKMKTARLHNLQAKSVKSCGCLAHELRKLRNEQYRQAALAKRLPTLGLPAK